VLFVRLPPVQCAKAMHAGCSEVGSDFVEVCSPSLLPPLCLCTCPGRIAHASSFLLASCTSRPDIGRVFFLPSSAFLPHFPTGMPPPPPPRQRQRSSLPPSARVGRYVEVQPCQSCKIGLKRKLQVYERDAEAMPAGGMPTRRPCSLPPPPPPSSFL